jgi:CBS domain-containing protein
MMGTTIGTVCRRRIVSVNAESTLIEAAALMREHHVGSLAIVTESREGKSVTGIVTDRDLVIDVLARGLDASKVLISDLASRSVVGVSEEDDLGDALAVMQANGVRRLLVTNREEHVVGIVSLDDLMDACASQLDGLAKVIRSGIEREVAERTPPSPPAPPIVLRVPAMGTAGWGQSMTP